jgi:hypothetical protein
LRKRVQLFWGFGLAAHGLSVLVKFIFGSGLKEKENQGMKGQSDQWGENLFTFN